MRRRTGRRRLLLVGATVAAAASAVALTGTAELAYPVVGAGAVLYGLDAAVRASESRGGIVARGGDADGDIDGDARRSRRTESILSAVERRDLGADDESAPATVASGGADAEGRDVANDSEPSVAVEDEPSVTGDASPAENRNRENA